VLPFFFTPLELIKSRQQMNAGSKSSVKIITDVIRKEGVSGLYVGHVMTTIRSTVGNATLFGPYVLAKDGLGWALGPDSSMVRPLSGIIAGWSSWLFCFPVDAIKTRMQVAEGAGHGAGDMRRLRPDQALLQLCREGALYRGIGPVLARAVPVHVAYLPVYDVVESMLREYT
jgi:solute carrier family 25 carnitine/acylcarnitine transporter 20/29